MNIQNYGYWETYAYWESEGTAGDGIERGQQTSFRRLSMFWTSEQSGHLSWKRRLPGSNTCSSPSGLSMYCRRIVELGAHCGVSCSAMCHAVKMLGRATSCFAVDTWKGDEHGGFYSENLYRGFAEFHDRRDSAFSRLARSFAFWLVDVLHFLRSEFNYLALHDLSQFPQQFNIEYRLQTVCMTFDAPVPMRDNCAQPLDKKELLFPVSRELRQFRE